MTGSATYLRRLFLIAAAFNLAVGGGLMLWPGRLYPFLGMPAPQERLTQDLFNGVVAFFGILFLWIAQRPAAHRDLMLAGALGKTWVFVVLAAHWLWIGDATFRTVLLGSVDLAFAALFAHAYWRTRVED